MRIVSQPLPLGSRLATFQPETFNAETRSVDVVFTTGAQVRRFSFFSGDFIEELSTKREHVRLDRLNKGAPLLDSHNGHGVRNVLGVIEKAKMVDGEGRATIRFSKRADIDPILADVKDGILRNISVGYMVHRAEEAGEVDGVKVIRAIDWEPAELSLVSVPADSGAQVRGGENINSCEF